VTSSVIYVGAKSAASGIGLLSVPIALKRP
jgi:hypothetical protein